MEFRTTQSQSGELHPDESIEAEELRALLERLHAPAPPVEQPDHYATVTAVCEATGHTAEEVWRVLEKLREEDMEARLAQRLREVEEPLYRVERPGKSEDPLSSATLMGRRRMFNSILDTVPRTPGKAVKRPLKLGEDQASKLASWLVLALTLLLFAIVTIAGVAGSFARR